jgi:hypothetical protein
LGVDEVFAELEPDRLGAERVLAGLEFAQIRGIGMPSRLLFGGRDGASARIALFVPRSDTLVINPVDSFWADPEGWMQRFARERVFPTANPDFPVLHELGHRSHYLTLSDPSQWIGLRGVIFDQSERRIIRREVGTNEAQDPLELVADIFTVLVEGGQFGEFVMSLYRRFGGPLP